MGKESEVLLLENHPIVQAALEGARMDMLYLLIGMFVLLGVPLWLLGRSASRAEQTWSPLAVGTVLETLVSPMPHLGEVPDDSYPGTSEKQTVITFTDGNRIAIRGDWAADLEPGAYVVISQNGSCRLRIDRPAPEQPMGAYRG